MDRCGQTAADVPKSDRLLDPLRCAPDALACVQAKRQCKSPLTCRIGNLPVPATPLCLSGLILRRPVRHRPDLAAPLNADVIDRLARNQTSGIAQLAATLGLKLTPAYSLRIAQEQLRMVLQHTRMGTLAASGFAVMLALYLLQQAGQPGVGFSALEVQVWLAAKLTVAVFRIALAQAYTYFGTGSQAWPRWQAAMLALLVADGAIWGLAGWRLMGESLPLAALGVAALDGVSCVATFGLQVRLAATAAYVLPILLPTALSLMLRQDGIAVLAGLGQLLLAGLALTTARATSRQLCTAMLLRLQAELLVQEKDAALALAREQSAERTRFVAKVSHELRTPLHGMLGLSRLLHLESHDPVTSHRLELIESSGIHLLELINDLLDVSRISGGQFSLTSRPVELGALLDQVAAVFSLRAADKGLQFELQSSLPSPCWVTGDAARLRQVLNNLLGNAVKFTHQGGIVLTAAHDSQADTLVLQVLDSGDGIAEADQARIFTPFQQGDGERPTDGVGLGLTIAREIAVAMGGDITVQSQAGRGSQFTFTAQLSVLQPDSRRALMRQAHEAQRLPHLVLVAEDDDVNALIVQAYLDELGVRSERVKDGKQAVRRALRETERPQAVLMDCRMPEMDGLAATTEIRRQERTLALPRLPIVALTATATLADRTACLAAGMDQVIEKPFTLQQLRLALRGSGQADLAEAAAAAPLSQAAPR